jgi:hypothetical protein
MGAFEARGNLAKAVHDLVIRWQDVKINWNDAQAEGIEKQYLQPLEIEVRSAVTAIDQLAILLSQAKRDCGND